MRGLKIAARQLVYLAIILATILTLSIATVYWLSNAVEQRQDEIAVWVSDKVGYPVEIGSARLDWVGLKPKLQVGNVRVLSKDSQQELFLLGKFYLGLDVIASIQSSTPVFNGITLIDLKLVLVRDLSGKIQLQGFQSTQIGDWEYWTQLLSRFYLETIQIDYMDQLKPALSGRYDLANAAIIHNDAHWTITGDLGLPDMLGQNIVFTVEADVNSDDIRLSTWQGQAKVNKVRLTSLADEFVWQGATMQQGNISAQLSIKGTGTKFEFISSDLNVSHVKIISNDIEAESTPVDIDLLQGKVDWTHVEQSWQLSGQLAVSINGEHWPETSFSVDKNTHGDWKIASQYLRLSDIFSLALLSNKTSDMFRQQQPAGDIEAFNLQYSTEKGLTELAFKLKEGVILPWADYPGVTNLTGQVNWENGAVNIHLDSHDIIVYAKPWLKNAIFLDALVGGVRLEYQQDNWQLFSRELRTWNDDLTLQLDGEVNKTDDGRIVNDLTLTLDNIAVNTWKKYVPRQWFSKKFKQWSDEAFIDGKMTTGQIKIKGELADFPYEKTPEKGSFNLALELEGVHLHYAPDWPDLTELAGRITGSGNTLLIEAKQGKTADFDFVTVTTTIDKFADKKPILRVKGEIKGTTANALQFLKDSPLKQRFGEVANSVIAKGKSNISLDLTVPLADIDNTAVSGYVSFDNSQLRFKEVAEIALTQLSGKLYFNKEGVKTKNIKAMVLNKPVNINVKPEGDKTVVSMLGHISSQDLTAIWPDKVPKFITGKTAYQVALTVVEREREKFYLDFDLSSDLKGLTLTMPSPFGKQTATAIPFNATMKNIDDAVVFTADFGDVLNIIAKPNNHLWQGEIRFGEGKAKLPSNGIKLSGQLEQLSIDDWIAWIKQQDTTDNILANSIDDVSIAVGELTGFKQKLTNLKLASQKDAKGWRANIDSDQAKGFVYLPNDLSGPEIINIDLTRLALALPQDKDESKSDQQIKVIDLWPNMTIIIDSLSLDEKRLGELELKAYKNDNSWVVRKAQLTSDIFTLSVSKAIWGKLPTGDKTALQLVLESDELGSLLSNFGYQQAIDAEKVTVKTNVSWPSNPLNFDVSLLSGLLNMDIEKGTLQNVKLGAADRVFGLMSMTALPQRLLLDFSDLFGKGFTFDSITGDFKFKNGLAITDNFSLKSASAEIEITGAVDLINQQYNQQVKITPNVSTTLPVAGAIAGGPIGLGVGTAILLADKLFGKNIVNVITYKYDLTGSWAEPQLNIVTPIKPINNTKIIGNGTIQ